MKLKNTRNIIWIVTLLSNTVLYAQQNTTIEHFNSIDTVLSNHEQQLLPTEILKKVEKNILLYRLIKRNENEVDEFDNILMKWEYFTTEFIEQNHILRLSYEKIDTLNFPDKGYGIF